MKRNIYRSWRLEIQDSFVPWGVDSHKDEIEFVGRTFLFLPNIFKNPFSSRKAAKVRIRFQVTRTTMGSETFPDDGIIKSIWTLNLAFQTVKDLFEGTSGYDSKPCISDCRRFVWRHKRVWLIYSSFRCCKASRLTSSSWAGSQGDNVKNRTGSLCCSKARHYDAAVI